MKIGVLTYHRANNYGAYLQAYALTMKLRDLGYDAEIIDYNMKKAEKQYEVHNLNPINWYQENLRRKMFESALKKLPLSDKCCISDSITDFENFIHGKYDAIIAGSDEIWKLNSFRGFPNPYWLLDNNGYQRFSYAASSRSDFSKLSDENRDKVKKTLRKFTLIGVRDSYTYDELCNLLEDHEKIIMCCDPVFMYDFKPDKERGREILKNNFGINIQEKTLGIMINDERLAKKIHMELKGEYQLVSLYRQWNGYKKTAKLTPFEWIDVVAALDVLVSNYFHGICFSLIANTYFIAIDSREKDIKRGKIYDLLSRNNCKGSFLSTGYEGYMDEAISMCRKCPQVEYSNIVNNERALGDAYFSKFSGALL